ncbi:MAG: helicase-associated domain-containing protein, partial [Planctomycetes bacterium]|nr:helicase-associated domain-containing protein [Planctomycetota bacterium]
MMRPDNPLIVQSDRSLMLHTVISVTDAHGRPQKDAQGRPMTREHPRFAEARDQLALFAELEKSPDYLHTYRITPISVWNAAAMGLTAERIEAILEELACVPVPRNVIVEVRGWIERYGMLRLEQRSETGGPPRYELVAARAESLAEVLGHRSLRELVELDPANRVFVSGENRGAVKQALIKLGFPVDDRGGYIEGDAFAIPL